MAHINIGVLRESFSRSASEELCFLELPLHKN